MNIWRRGLRGVGLTTVALGAIGLAVWPRGAPGLILAGLITTSMALAWAWNGARGTELRPALVWAGLAIGLAALAQLLALGEALESGRPTSGQVMYLATLCTLAAMTSVLNARRPGGGAWAVLMALLVLVWLIPWLEGAGLTGGSSAWDRLRLEAPWTIFYGLLVLAGITNGLPTRLGGAAALLGAGLVMEYLGLTRIEWPLTWRGRAWTAVAWTFAAAVWVGEASLARRPMSPPGLARLWRWFRDRWGVVWGLRVAERFNRSATAAGWPVRLTWFGPVRIATSDGADQQDAVEQTAEMTLMNLLRRFADEDRLRAAAGHAAGPCPSEEVRGS